MKTFNLTVILLFISIFAQGINRKSKEKPEFDDIYSYDVLKYKIEFFSDPKSNDFSGKTTIYFKGLKTSNYIELDAGDNLSIKEIKYHKQEIKNYTHENNKLKIVLPSVIFINIDDSISVSYTGKSIKSNTTTNKNSYNNNINTNISDSITNISDSITVIPIEDNNEIISAYQIKRIKSSDIEEHFSACTFAESENDPKTWFICKDGLTDKADEIEFHITHPSSYKAVANGLLESATQNPDSTTTTIWKHQYPIPCYLVAFAVAEYKEYHQNVKIGNYNVPILNYIYPGKDTETFKRICQDLDKVPYYISVYSEMFGDYPFKKEKYGHAEWFYGGAMEHSTITFMSSSWQKYIILHELAHQWFGDNITCSSWSDIWLNEGFATFGEGLMYQHEGDEVKMDDWYKNNLYSILQYGEKGSVYNPEPNNMNRTFDYILTYCKSGMVVNQLKNLLGKELFFKAIRNFLQEYQYSFASTEDFKASLKKSTGRDLTEFFNDWVYGEGYPIFRLDLIKNTPSEVVLKVEQTQTHPSVSFFETPFKVKFIGNNNQSVIKEFNLTQNHQTFQITDIPFAVTELVFNPNSDLIAKEMNKTVNTPIIESEELVKVIMDSSNNLLAINSLETIKSLHIYDISGKLINQSNVPQKMYSIETNNWNPGVYIVMLHTSKGIISRKVLK